MGGGRGENICAEERESVVGAEERLPVRLLLPEDVLRRYLSFDEAQLEEEPAENQSAAGLRPGPGVLLRPARQHAHLHLQARHH